MYQMPSYQPDFNHSHMSQQYGQLPDMGLPHTIQLSPYIQQVAPQPPTTQQTLSQQLPQPSMRQPPFKQRGLGLSPISLKAKPLNLTQPILPSPMSLYDQQSQSQARTPLTDSPQLPSWNIGNGAVPPPLTLEDESVYKCNIVAQLQGNWEIDTPAGPDQVSVVVPNIAKGEEQYAIVRRVCSDGDALPDQFIYDEADRFTLCSVDENVEAVLRKGMNMKHSVSWDNVNGGNPIIWRRKGEVTFNLVHVDSRGPSRRNSISSVGTASTNLSSCLESPMIGPDGIPMHIRPELLHQNFMPQRPVVLNSPPLRGYNPNENYQPGNNLPMVADSAAKCDPQQQAMFELIKAHCVGNPALLKKVVQWGKQNAPKRRVTREDANNLSEGRLWITAHAVNVGKGGEVEESLQESLDNIKGAYTEVRPGVYMQPEPQMSEPGEQHRLLKTPRGYWKIEGHDVQSGRWIMCAQQLPDGRWVDMKNMGKVIRVQLVPMIRILERLGEALVTGPGNQEVEKNMEFLFTSCNQKKLNSKLKGRNLKHNIANLKVKLEKQYKLSFAVQVANTADSIAMQLGALQ